MNDYPESSRKDTRRVAQKQIARSSFLALAALGVIAFACYAWFVNNSNVSGTQVSVSASGSRFELASVGDIKGIFDDQLSDVEQAEGSIWKTNNNGRITNSDRTILWRVSKDSNLGNLVGSVGIEPGSEGKLQFYVVPQGVDSLSLTFTLEIIPLKSQGEKLVQFTEPDPVAQSFLKGHLLVRYKKDGDTTSTLVNPESGTFSLVVNGTDPVLVTLDWSWPYLLEDAIKDDTVKLLVNSFPQYFLFDGKNPVQLPDEGSFNLPEKGDPLFRKYSNFYNNADQYIGTTVAAILFRLTAIEG